jgi:hypothetical protein
MLYVLEYRDRILDTKAAVAERLVAAGADISALGNGQGRTLLQMAQGNKEMQEALRRLGAT